MNNSKNFRFMSPLTFVGSMAAALMLAISTVASGDALDIASVGQSYELSSSDVDGSVVLSGEGANLIVAPGMHGVHGDFVVNGKDSSVTIAFNSRNQHGELKVDGKIDISGEANPMLGLSLGDASLTKGQKITLFTASEVHGTFKGLTNGEVFEVDGSKLKIGYSDDSVWVMVVGVRRDWITATPVVRIDPGLIDPTSTSPEFF